jgi:hypothetical protein
MRMNVEIVRADADDVMLWWMEESDEGGEKRRGEVGLRVAIGRGRCCCCVVLLSLGSRCPEVSCAVCFGTLPRPQEQVGRRWPRRTNAVEHMILVLPNKHLTCDV